MTDDNPLMTADPAREIERSRILDAPRELVLRAWTEAEHLAAWWGPKDFTNAFEEFDPRPGGAWRFKMLGPNGAEFPNQSVFLEATADRVVIDHVSGPEFRMFATFEDRGDQTAITILQRFASAQDCAQVLKFAPTANDENLDRLEAELARMA